MLIDFHAHTFPDKIATAAIADLEQRANTKATREGTVAGLLSQMEQTGVDMSVILPVVTKPKQFQSVNDYAAKVNEDYKGKLISLGGIHPMTDSYKEELDYIVSLGLKGIKIHPDYQGVFIDETRFMQIIDRASELGLIIVTHAGVDIGLPDPVHCPPDKALKIIREVKPEKLVLAHTGGWKQWDMVEELLAGLDVYFDCAFSSRYLSAAQFERIVNAHGADKVLFATDTPWESPAETRQWIEKTQLTPEQKSYIYSKNAELLLGLQ